MIDEDRRSETAAATLADDARGAVRLITESTRRTTSVVQEMHDAIGSVPLFSDPVYAAVRAVAGAVGVGAEAAVAAFAPLLGSVAPSVPRDAIVAALNGVVGDHLEATGNPLAVKMALHVADAPRDARTLLVLVHGSAMNHHQWLQAGHDHGAFLGRELGVLPAYVHYNSGRHTSTNGRELAELLDVSSVGFDDVVIVAHSMGGLVARAAIAVAGERRWRAKLRGLITLGTPHHGSRLERAGNLFETLGTTRWTSPLQTLARLRSAGITDLRFGNVVDADWQGHDQYAFTTDQRQLTPLPLDVRCCAVAATDDALVAPTSALGEHEQVARTLHFAEVKTVKTTHLGLLASDEVAALLRGWLGEMHLAGVEPSTAVAESGVAPSAR